MSDSTNAPSPDATASTVTMETPTTSSVEPRTTLSVSVAYTSSVGPCELVHHQSHPLGSYPPGQPHTVPLGKHFEFHLKPINPESTEQVSETISADLNALSIGGEIPPTHPHYVGNVTVENDTNKKRKDTSVVYEDPDTGLGND